MSDRQEPLKTAENNIQDAPQRCIQAEPIVHKQQNTPAWPSGERGLNSYLTASQTDCHWDTDQRKLGENGRKLHGDIAHSGLCHVTQQQTPVLCCLRARKRKRRTCGSAMQIIQHPSCQVASTTDPERDQNRVPPLPAKPKENKGTTQSRVITFATDQEATRVDKNASVVFCHWNLSWLFSTFE